MGVWWGLVGVWRHLVGSGGILSHLVASGGITCHTCRIVSQMPWAGPFSSTSVARSGSIDAPRKTI